MQVIRKFFLFNVVVVAFVNAVGSARAGELTLMSMNAKENVYRLIVKSDVKPFEVHLIFNKDKDKRAVEKLNIYRGRNLLQSFTPHEDIELISENAALLEPEIVIEDMNFDGYDDLKVFAGRDWSSWSYNPEKDRFEEKEEPLKLMETTEREQIYSLFVKRNVKPLAIKLLITKDPEEFNDKVKIEIFRGRRLLQSLSEEIMPPFEGAELLSTYDMNFDGYNDLEILESWSPMGNNCWSFWLYNPQKDRFELNNELNSLCNPSPDEKSKILTTWWNGGAASRIYIIRIYKWKGEKLVLIGNARQDIEEDSDDEKKVRFHKVITKLRNGKMVVVSDRFLSDEEAREENHKGTQLDY